MLDDVNLLILAWQIHLPNPIRKTICKSHILSPEVNSVCPPMRQLSYASEFQKILHTSEVKEWNFQFSWINKRRCTLINALFALSLSFKLCKFYQLPNVQFTFIHWGLHGQKIEPGHSWSEYGTSGHVWLAWRVIQHYTSLTAVGNTPPLWFPVESTWSYTNTLVVLNLNI